jgi:hypothetical protein
MGKPVCFDHFPLLKNNLQVDKEYLLVRTQHSSFLHSRSFNFTPPSFFKEGNPNKEHRKEQDSIEKK